VRDIKDGDATIGELEAEIARGLMKEDVLESSLYLAE